MGQLSCYSQVLLLPLDVSPVPAMACFAQSISQDDEVQRVPTTTDVGMYHRARGRGRRGGYIHVMERYFLPFMASSSAVTRWAAITDPFGSLCPSPSPAHAGQRIFGPVSLPWQRRRLPS